MRKALVFLVVMLVAVVICYGEAHAADILPDIYHAGVVVTVKGADTDGTGAGSDYRLGWVINSESLPIVVAWGHYDQAKLVEGIEIDQGGLGTSLVFPGMIPALRMDWHFNVFADAGKIEGEPVKFSTLTGSGVTFQIQENERFKTRLTLSGEYTDVAGMNIWSIRAGMEVEVK